MNTLHKIVLVALCTLVSITASAQKLPKQFDKVRKALLSITTYQEDGSEKSTGTAFFIAEDGTALADYTLFEGAKRAIATDVEGKTYEVSTILGANEMYDVVKFQVKEPKKITTIPWAKEGAKPDETLYLLRYSTEKMAIGESAKVEEVTTVTSDQLPYYTLAVLEGKNYKNSPVINSKGELIAMAQAPASATPSLGYALSIEYCNTLKINALSAGSRVLQRIGIAKALPNTEQEALVYLYTKSGQEDQAEYITCLNSFISTYPKNVEGYIYRAQYYAKQEEYTRVDEEIERAKKIAIEKDLIHYNYSKLIAQAVLQRKEIALGEWTLERALEEANIAYTLNPLPLYLMHKADIHYTLKQYQEAYNTYIEVTQTNLKSAQVYMYAAQAKKMINGEAEEILALQDSAIAQFITPLPQEAAPYLLLRAQSRTTCNLSRLAVLDYNEYERLVAGQVNDQFYYERAQAEIASRMYLQALDDMSKAVRLNPNEPHYLCLYGSLLYSSENYTEAIEVTQKAITLTPEYADAYRIMGLSLLAKEEKKKGIEALQKAKELGDEISQRIIEERGY